MKDRIELPDEDIWINEDYSNDHDIPNKGQYVYCPQLPWFATKEEAEQLKKQILEDSDKAEELDDLKKRFITTKNIVSTMETVQRNNNKLESQNKELKDKAEKWDNYWNRPQDYRGLAELQMDNRKLEQQNKELKDKAEKYDEMCDKYDELKQEMKEDKAHTESLKDRIIELEQQNKELRVYKSRYEEMQERYLNGTEKYFGEILSLYFDDEPSRKELLGSEE